MQQEQSYKELIEGIEIYQVDAFTNTVFNGNPACVVVFDKFVPDDLMQKIAMEKNQAETAFLTRNHNKQENQCDFYIRWFTPDGEIVLCAHATMCASHVIFNCLKHERDDALLQSKTKGVIQVQRKDVNKFTVDFPLYPLSDFNIAERKNDYNIILEGLGLQSEDIVDVRVDSFKHYVVVLQSKKALDSITHQNIGKFLQLPDCEAVFVTSPSDNDYFDFASRFFFPFFGVTEDPTCGSAHCSIGPYWQEKTGKTSFKALAASKRTGEVHFEIKGDRCLITGQTKLFMVGKMYY